MKNFFLISIILLATTSLMAQNPVPKAETTIPTNGKTTIAQPPFYALYTWCSAVAEQKWLIGNLKEVGIKFISSVIDDDPHTEEGMLLCAKNGIQVAGIVSPNTYCKNMDIEKWKADLKKYVERYGHPKARGTVYHRTQRLACYSQKQPHHQLLTTTLEAR